MTRMCLTLLASILCLNSVAKNDSKNTKPAKYKAGVGLQYTYPHAALSLKIGLTQHSVVQVMAAPYSFDNTKTNFYGARYHYLFSKKPSTKLWGEHSEDFPYLYLGGGLLQSSTTNTSNSENTNSFLGYMGGLGYEVIFSKRIGLSFELGYGALSVRNGETIGDLTGGGGLHIYFNKNKPTSTENNLRGSIPNSNTITPENDEAEEVATGNSDAIDFFGKLGDEENTGSKGSKKTKSKKNKDISKVPRFFGSGDVGRNSLYSDNNNINTTTNGYTGALQLGFLHDLKSKSEAQRFIVSYGLEGRIFSGERNITDAAGSSFNKFRFSYIGLPVSLWYVSTDAISKKKKKAGLYIQGGLIASYLLGANTEEGTFNTVVTSTSLSGYNRLAVNGNISTGFAFAGKKATFLVGPYLTYTLTNISNVDGVNNRLLSYGLRFHVIPNINTNKKSKTK